MNYLVTYEDALEMVKVYKDFNFSKSEYMFGDYKVVTFTYFLCDYMHFTKPLSRKPEVNGLDMRGVTFVFNADGSLYKRFLMLRKFFNLNQVESTQYGLVKDKKIKSITNKEDGSLVAFISLPDDTVVAKTIGSFDNEQTVAAMKIFNENTGINFTVKAMLYQGMTPLFEYVSFDNRIVLKYSKPELRYIGCRNNNTGEFVPAYRENAFDLVATENFDNFTLDELIEKSKTEKDIEGWVVEFEDGQMLKIKTEWYFNLHGIRTENIFREDFVIKNYLEEKLDDVVGRLDEVDDADAFKFIEHVKLAVDNYIEFIDVNVTNLVKIFNEEYRSEWHYFAKFNNKEAFFGLSVFAIQTPETYNRRKIEYIINKTKHLKVAQSFVDKWAGKSDGLITKWNANGKG